MKDEVKLSFDSSIRLFYCLNSTGRLFKPVDNVGGSKYFVNLCLGVSFIFTSNLSLSFICLNFAYPFEEIWPLFHTSKHCCDFNSLFAFSMFKYVSYFCLEMER